MMMVSELHLPGLVSSLLFSGVVAWSVFMPFFSSDAERVAEGERPGSAASNSLEQIYQTMVSLELAFRAGSIEQTEYAERLNGLRRRAAGLIYLVRRSGRRE